MKLPKFLSKKKKDDGTDKEQEAAAKKESNESKSEVADKKNVANSDEVAEATNDEHSSEDTAEDQTPAKIVSKSGEPTQLTNNQMKQLLAKRAAKTESTDYLVIRIRKQTVLIALGTAILTMWSIPLSQTVDFEQIATNGQASVKSLLENLPFGADEAESEDTVEATTSANIENPNDDATRSADLDRSYIRVRLRTNDPELTTASELTEILQQLEYQVVDTITDDSQEYSKIEIAVKRRKDPVRDILSSDLNSVNYSVASSSAELTEDSDFDAVIMVGE